MNVPVICAWPPGIRPFTVGADTTLPSSTIANWSSTEVGWPPLVYWVYICEVRSLNFFAPSLLKLRLTCQALADCGFSEALALVTIVPSTRDLSSAYLTRPWPGMFSQDTIWLLGSSHLLGWLL